jgi:MFS family permease
MVHLIGDDHRRISRLCCSALLVLFCLTLNATAQDPQPVDFPGTEQEEFGNPMVLGLLVVCFLIVCFLALLLGIFAAIILAGVITGGIISASVATGVFQRSVSSGFRALFVQIGAVVGLLTGAVGAMIFIWLAKIPSSSPQPWVIGVLAGLVWGVLSACLFNFAWRRIVEWIGAKFQRRKAEGSEKPRIDTNAHEL